MHCFSVWRHRLLRVAWLLAGLAALLPRLATAQTDELQITLRDVGGQGIAGISVVVRSEDGQELARQVTTDKGGASFHGLPAVVRVAVEGQPRGGPRLYQLGDDAQGVRVDLGQAPQPATLDLRVERDGLVLPNPATMLMLEEGGALVVESEPIPTAALATPAPLPSTASTAPQVVVGVGAPPSEAPRRAGWAPLVTLLVIALAAGVMLLIQRRRSAL
jgi:hypothetical protein